MRFNCFFLQSFLHTTLIFMCTYFIEVCVPSWLGCAVYFVETSMCSLARLNQAQIGVSSENGAKDSPGFNNRSFDWHYYFHFSIGCFSFSFISNYQVATVAALLTFSNNTPKQNSQYISATPSRSTISMQLTAIHTICSTHATIIS